MPHLVVSISGHGFGHVAQTAPILNALHALMPDLRITVRSAVPAAHLISRLNFPFQHLGSEGDMGMVMNSPLDVDIEQSRAAYRRFHTEWDFSVEQEACLLNKLKADYVFSNVGYLALAGAQLAGIGNAALCSLNWFDIYTHYCGSRDTQDLIISRQIFQAYSMADAFLRVTPGMGMATLPNVVNIEPVAELGKNRREMINRQLSLGEHDKLVLVSLGGIATRLPMERWPRISGVKYLVQKSWQVEHPDVFELESLDIHFSDVLASSDVLLCKPGYGSFVEAGYSAIPVLFVGRPDWPESLALVSWLHENAVSLEISREQLECGDLACAFDLITSRRCSLNYLPEGTQQAARWLAAKF